jgi:hypothetical protein
MIGQHLNLDTDESAIIVAKKVRHTPLIQYRKALS